LDATGEHTSGDESGPRGKEAAKFGHDTESATNFEIGCLILMPAAPGKLYIPPYSGVRLIECRDHFQLVPVPAVRKVYGYGKIKASKVTCDPDDPNSEPFWDDLAPDDDVWAVMQWYVYEDGHQEQGNISFLRPECSEEQARKSMEKMEGFSDGNREDALALLQCYEASEDDHAYVEDNYPNYQTEPDPSDTDNYDVYHARLKVMEELQPKTVALLKIANCTKDTKQRQIAEREAVQSYFAELAHYFTSDEILAWQRSNPIGTSWMREHAKVFDQPRRTIDPVNHELALNWLREKYNLLTARELSESIFQRVLRWLRLDRLTPEAIKKRRERLGLTTKMKPGSPEK
jgi:hypothetical protein